MLETENTVVVVVLIFLKHNDMYGQAISSSQLCSQSIKMKIHTHVMHLHVHCVHGHNCACNL